ncbi:DUF2062 domain-containing protein [Roseobacteraceae bacterium S113]
MVFKRRDRKPLGRAVLEFFWPRGGWGRAAQYVKHRLRRLPDPPERIARGIWAGVFTTFTPFYGLHFIVAGVLAVAMRGNLLAALLSTFFGNPLTYVPIGIVSLQTGHWLLGSELQMDVEASLGEKFAYAAGDFFSNIGALLKGYETDWSALIVFWHDVFYPYWVGGILPGIFAATVSYYISLPVIRAYKKRRKGAIKARFEALKARATERAAEVKPKGKKPVDGSGPAE